MKMLIITILLFSGIATAAIKNESELSMIQSGGNSEVMTANGKSTILYKWPKNAIQFGGHYTYGESKNFVSARNWDALTRYEREMTSKLSLVGGEIIEGNEFVRIKARYNTDLGAKYFHLKDPGKIFFTELVYRYAIEDRYDPLDNSFEHKGRLYNEFEHKYAENMKYSFWLEYVPNFNNGEDYLVNGEISLTSIISSTFSLKVSYKGQYDNRPASDELKNYDFISTTGLVANF